MKKALFILFFFALFAGCFYDKESEMHPNGAPNTCDTASVTYSNQIRNIINSDCISCHFSGGVSHYDFSSWGDLNSCAMNGQLMGSIQNQSGHPQMPTTYLLDACKIRQFQIWVNANAPNN